MVILTSNDWIYLILTPLLALIGSSLSPFSNLKAVKLNTKSEITKIKFEHIFKMYIQISNAFSNIDKFIESNYKSLTTLNNLEHYSPYKINEKKFIPIEYDVDYFESLISNLHSLWINHAIFMNQDVYLNFNLYLESLKTYNNTLIDLIKFGDTNNYVSNFLNSYNQMRQIQEDLFYKIRNQLSHLEFK